MVGVWSNALERLRRPSIRLFVTSAALLFVELLLIRWIPANVTYVGFFRNFLLMASFLGIGVGILWGRDARRLPVSPFGPLLLGLVLLVNAVQVNLLTQAGTFDFVILPALVVLVSVVMAGLAVPLGALLVSMAPLRAYAIDIAGSMTGVAAFTVLSAVGTQPIVWFGLVAVLSALMGFAAGLRFRSLLTAASIAGVLVVVVLAARPGQTWSPYYRIDEYQVDGISSINVNGIPHQAMWPKGRIHDPFYEQVYRWFPDRTFPRVLVIGAGTGTDIAVALSHGSAHVDAVEIDPAIQAIGIRDHPDRPYDDPRVTRFVDDGRAFLRTSTDRYDLVIFALPDSLTLVSTSANVRLESFLFTTESFEAVRGHLTDSGLFVLYNFYRSDWLPVKIGGMLDEVFPGTAIARLYGGAAATLAAGPAVESLQGAPPPGDRVDSLSGTLIPKAATDDWPFLYLQEPVIEPYYLVALALVIAFSVLLVWRAASRSGTSIRRFSPHFFVLGVAFLLLETRSLVTFSLLFGSTWIVNALVFFGMLASVLLAVLIHARYQIDRAWLLYVGLFVSIAITLVLPPAALLLEPAGLRYLLAVALAFTPVFFANLVFAHSFRDTQTADMAFASNLLGAVVGGAIEYIALLTGYWWLLVVVAALYAVAWLLASRFRLLADRDLLLEPARPWVTTA